nr:hypothetical protein Iba_chr10aCG4400 [Ipomoea batatas]
MKLYCMKWLYGWIRTSEVMNLVLDCGMCPSRVRRRRQQAGGYGGKSTTSRTPIFLSLSPLSLSLSLSLSGSESAVCGHCTLLQALRRQEPYNRFLFLFAKIAHVFSPTAKER